VTNFAVISREGLTVARADGDGWHVEKPLVGPGLRCLAADSLVSGRLYAGRDGEGVLRSLDGGRTWSAVGMGGRNLRSLAVSPTTPGRVYAGTRPAALFVSDDVGETWHELPALAAARRWYWLTPAEPITAYVQAIALSPDNPEVLLVGIETGAVLRSQDGGRSFSGHCRGAMRDCHSLAFHPGNGSWSYQGGSAWRSGGGRVSSDGGRTWRKPGGTGYLGYGWAVAPDAAEPGTWYFSAAPGAFRAHGGRNASAQIYRCQPGSVMPLEGGLPQPLQGMPYALIADPDERGCLYTGLSNGEVWCTHDRGETWSPLDLDIGRIERAMVCF
jgi:hypothetical protein